MNDFEEMELTTQINDLILHYKRGHDEDYKKKALIVKNRIKQLEAQNEILIEALRDIYHADLGDEDLSMEELIAKEALSKVNGGKSE